MVKKLRRGKIFMENFKPTANVTSLDSYLKDKVVKFDIK